MNTASENRIKKLHPELALRVRTMIERLLAGGVQVEVVQGLRTFAEQDALFAQGRTKAGQIVTNARGGFSNHNYALAADVVPFTNAKPNWKAPNSIWIAIGTEAIRLGLEWGGSWKKFIDKPHVQIPGPPVAECLRLFKRGGLEAVWAVVTPDGTGGGTSPAPGPVPERTLRQGDRGEDVRLVQTRLASLGLIKPKNIDGIFGPGTHAAVRKFQASKGLKVDGKVGPKTRVALMS